MVAVLQSDNDSSQEWSECVEILQSAYLSGLNPRVREPFLNAVGAYNDPADFHHRFRLVGAMLMRPDVVVASWQRLRAGTSPPVEFRVSDRAAVPCPPDATNQVPSERRFTTSLRSRVTKVSKRLPTFAALTSEVHDFSVTTTSQYGTAMERPMTSLRSLLSQSF